MAYYDHHHRTHHQNQHLQSLGYPAPLCSLRPMQPMHHSATRRGPGSRNVWTEQYPIVPSHVASSSSSSSLWLHGPLPPIQTGMVYPSSSSECSPLDVNFPSSPSDCSSVYSGPSPSPEYTYVVCNAPLVAPKPLPYHSPTFLQYDLPDDDEDLSHPPYVGRPHKRKREVEDEDQDETEAEDRAKRQAVPSPGFPSWPHRSARSREHSSSAAAAAAAAAAPRAPAITTRRHGRQR